MIVIDLRKQQPHDADPKAIQQTNLTENLNRAGNPTSFFIIKEGNKPFQIFHQEP